MLHFQPDSGECEYFSYRRHEILEHLLRWNADILVAGDSMMRQVSLRFPTTEQSAPHSASAKTPLAVNLRLG